MTCLLLSVRQVQMEPRSFVLEIGTEELPPSDVAHASQEVSKLICNLFFYKFVLRPIGYIWVYYTIFCTLEPYLQVVLADSLRFLI